MRQRSVRRLLVDSGQRLGSQFPDGPQTGTFGAVALADLDGDGNLDALVGSADGTGGASVVFRNRGGGFFKSTEQRVGDDRTIDVALGDLNGDGYPDAVLASLAAAGAPTHEDHVYFNNGTGYLEPGPKLGNASSSAVVLADVNGDGAVDVFFANTASASVGADNALFLNLGDGSFVDSGQSFGIAISFDAAAGDLNGNGAPDLFIANRGGKEIWLNDGDGNFSLSGSPLGDSESRAVALGDIDGDDDLDAVVGNAGIAAAGLSARESNRLWINNGGVFTDSGLAMGNESTSDVALADIDGDGALDAYFANFVTTGSSADQIWLNDNGVLVDSGERLEPAFFSTDSRGIALGSLDSDGDADAFVATDGGNVVWLGTSSTEAGLITIDADKASRDPNGVPLITAVEGPMARVEVPLMSNRTRTMDVVVNYDWPDIVTPPLQSLVLPGPAPQGVRVAVALPPIFAQLSEPEVTTFAITSANNGFGIGNPSTLRVVVSDLETVLANDREPNRPCYLRALCGLAEELSLDGVLISNWCAFPIGKSTKGNAGSLDEDLIYRFRDEVMMSSDGGRYYISRYYQTSPSLVRTTLSAPTLVYDVLEASRLWTPAIASVLDGDGSELITPEMVLSYEDIVDQLRERADASLRALIELEDRRINPRALVGLTASEFWDVLATADIDPLFSAGFEL